MGGYPGKMGITWDDLMDMGRNNPGDKAERFCMSVFACNTSQEVNGVSWLHVRNISHCNSRNRLSSLFAEKLINHLLPILP